MIALGYDLAFVQSGWGVIKKDGNIEFVDSGSFSLKAQAQAETWKDTEKLIDILKWLSEDVRYRIERFSPDRIGVESAFGKDKFLNLFFARISTVILLEAIRSEIPTYLVHPSTLKKIVTGNGRATKEEVQASLIALLGIPQPERTKRGRMLDGEEDRFDALGVALTILNKGGESAIS
jgi:crossover junction endodeoxyribonuclease RuvC